MPKLVARCITISLDGFSGAKGQALDAPFGKDGLRLMEWAFATKYFAKMTGQEGGAEGLDNDFLVHSDDNIGATIMGRTALQKHAAKRDFRSLTRRQAVPRAGRGSRCA